MLFKPGDKVRVVNCYSGGNFEDGDIVTIHQIGNEDEDDVYGAISPHDGGLWWLCEDEVAPLSCEYCRGETNIAVTEQGKMFIHDAELHIIRADATVFRASIRFCPMCGRPF